MILPRIDDRNIAATERASGDAKPFWVPLAPNFPDAGCLEEYPDLWFPYGYVQHEDQMHVGISDRIAATAVDICYDCPHMLACGDYAVNNRIEHGIWGGLTEKDRHGIWAREAA